MCVCVACVITSCHHASNPGGLPFSTHCHSTAKPAQSHGTFLHLPTQLIPLPSNHTATARNRQQQTQLPFLPPTAPTYLYIMSDAALEAKFQDAAKRIAAWKPKKDPSDDEKLEVYALYKQATVGDCTTAK